jgi:hypothetical protein
MRYTRQHLIGSIVLIIAQMVAAAKGQERWVFICGLAQVPFIILLVKTIFTSDEEEEHE